MPSYSFFYSLGLCYWSFSPFQFGSSCQNIIIDQFIGRIMAQKPTLNPQSPQNPSKLPKDIPITYLWFGKTVPEDYLISLAELDYPVNFIKNAELDRQFKRPLLDIEKSDYYRLQYLYEYGGIYSDFDNIIDYPCLMKLLQPYRNQDKLVFMTDGKHTRAKMRQMTNNLIFAPYPKMPLLKKMLDKVDQTKSKIWGFAGMKFVAKFPEPIELPMAQCVKHTGDWSWVNASNQVLKRKAPPHSRFAKKNIKKIDIIEQNIKLENEVKRQKQQSSSLRNELIKLKTQNSKLRAKNNETNKILESQIVTNPKAQTEHNQKIGLGEVHIDKDKLLLQNQVQDLTQRNSHLEYQKDVFFLMTSGGLILALILLIVGLLYLRAKKLKQFKNLSNNERSVSELE